MRDPRTKKRAAAALIGGSMMWWGVHALAYDSYGADLSSPDTFGQVMQQPPWPIGPGYFGTPPIQRATPLDDGGVLLGPPEDTLTRVSDYTVQGNPARNVSLGNRTNFGLGYNRNPYADPDRTAMYSANFSQGPLYFSAPDAGVTNPAPVAGLYSCAKSAMPADGGFDLTQCTIPELTDTLASSMPGWARTRRRWDLSALGSDFDEGHAPEHMLLANEALQYAGLGTNPLFDDGNDRDVFWVRYPGADQYVASIQSKPLIGSTSYLAGQSWMPVPPAQVGALVTRGYHLTELAQLPDVSHSVWDWVGGDEDCPETIIAAMRTGAGPLFGDPAADMNACHEFQKVMGAVNSSHFLPAAKGYYSYYHGMAVARMGVCRSLAPIAAAFAPPPWDDEFSYTTWLPPIPYDTEAHECEREALVYEMVAQHYLQDAWSTGHMWYRWGTPNLAAFPDSLGPWPYGGALGGLYSDTSPNPDNSAARRFAIAAIVAAFGGMEHGAKGVLADLPISKIPGDWIDDPLCGPNYWNPWLDIPQQTNWVLGSSLNYGVGDLYLHTLHTTGYDEQRTHLLACSAKSMRDVYGAGPQMHGPLDLTTSIPRSDGEAPMDPATVDVSSDYCWGQLASNASMFGALGPFYVRRKWDPAEGSFEGSLAESMIKAVNRLVAGKIGVTPSYPNLADQAQFALAAQARLQADLDNVALQFSLHALRPSGTEAAQLLMPGAGAALPPGTGGEDAGAGDGGLAVLPAQITFFNVSPNQAPPAGAPPAPYSDIDDPTVTGQPSYVRQMFWKSHLLETCDDAASIPVLRDRCVNAAANGGDPDACTECVALAQLHIQSCSTTGVAGPSKCQMIGGDPNLSMLPAWMTDPAQCHCEPTQFADPRSDPGCGTPPLLPATYYCTGTTDNQGGFSTADLWVTEPGQTPEQSRARIGVYADGTYASYSGPPVVDVTHHHLAPLIDSYEETITWDTVAATDPFGNPITQYRATADRDKTLEAMMPGLPLWKSYEHGYIALATDWEPLAVPRCGTTQRFTFWNQSCNQVLTSQPLKVINGITSDFPIAGAPDGGAEPPDMMNGIQIPFTGQWYLSHTGPSIVYDPDAGLFGTETPGDPQPRCSVQEQRQYTPTCPDNATCSADGACVFGRYDGTGVSPAPLPTWTFLK